MELEFWTNISIVLIALNCFVLLIIPMAIFYFAVRGMDIVNSKVPPFLQRAQGWSQTMRTQTKAVTDKIADPVVRSQAEIARAETAARELLPKGRQGSSTEEESREP